MKKYVPSGYQIINLGEIVNGTTIDNEELISLLRNNKKPILLECKVSGSDIIGFPTFSNSNNNILIEMGFQYQSNGLPTYLIVLAVMESVINVHIYEP